MEGGRQAPAHPPAGTLPQHRLERGPEHVDRGGIGDLLDGESIPCERPPLGTGHLVDGPERRPEALVRERLVGLGDFEGAEIDGSEQQGRGGPDRSGHPEPFEDIGHPRDPD